MAIAKEAVFTMKLEPELREAEKARAGIAAGNWSTHEEVDVRAAVRRAELQRGIDETNS